MCTRYDSYYDSYSDSYQLGSYWPEEIIAEILEAGATGPHVTAILDKAQKLGSTRIITSGFANNAKSLPERALVWALEEAITKLDKNQNQDNETNLGNYIVYFNLV